MSMAFCSTSCRDLKVAVNSTADTLPSSLSPSYIERTSRNKRFCGRLLRGEGEIEEIERKIRVVLLWLPDNSLCNCARLALGCAKSYFTD